MSEAPTLHSTAVPEVALGTGRRKTSVARVRIRRGQGKLLINERAMEDFFPSEQQRAARLGSAEVERSAGAVGHHDPRPRRRHHWSGRRLQAGPGPRPDAAGPRVGSGPARQGPLDPRWPHEGTQEVRSAGRPPRHAVLQALSRQATKQFSRLVRMPPREPFLLRQGLGARVSPLLLGEGPGVRVVRTGRWPGFRAHGDHLPRRGHSE